jgi:hypothetical protein
MQGYDKRNRLHMRRAFAEFIYNCLSNELGNKIREELKNLTVSKNKIHYDGPMVWLTLMNHLFSTNNGPSAFRSSMETCTTNLKIVDDKYLEYTFKIQNGLRLVPALKTGTNVIDTICSEFETHKRSFLLNKTLNTTTDFVLGNAFGDLFSLSNNWDKLKKLHKVLEWNEKIEQENWKSEQEKYPNDCYSFLSLNRPDQKGLPAYSFGLMVWVFQMTLLTSMVVSVSV